MEKSRVSKSTLLKTKSLAALAINIESYL
jgi:hypothetical protein